MRNVLNILALAGLSLLATSCFDKSKPNYQFFPNMYEPVPYETYSEHSVFPGGKEGLIPAQGTVKRGFTPYEIPNTPEGYALAKASLKRPADITIDPDKGKRII